MQSVFLKTEILLAAAVVISLLSLGLAVFSIVRYRRLYRAYDFFMRGRDTESLEEFIMKEKEEIAELQSDGISNREAMRIMNRNLRSAFQKIGLVHYDAFQGMGGKMSFALAALDYTNSGIVLNCMHSREGCFIYIKEIDAGTTDTPLGTEEKEALERALGYIKD